MPPLFTKPINSCAVSFPRHGAEGTTITLYLFIVDANSLSSAISKAVPDSSSILTAPFKEAVKSDKLYPANPFSQNRFEPIDINNNISAADSVSLSLSSNFSRYLKLSPIFCSMHLIWLLAKSPEGYGV